MQCRKARKLLLPYSDGELNNKQSDILKTHLEICEVCCKMLEQFGSEREALRGEIPLRAPDGFVDEVMAAVQSVARSQQNTQPSSFEIWHALWYWWRRYSPIAAVVFSMIAVGAIYLSIRTETKDYSPFIKGDRGDFRLPGMTYSERQFYLQQHRSAAMYAKTLDRWHHNMSVEGNIIYYEISRASQQGICFQAFIVRKNQPNEKLPVQLPQTPPSLANSHIIKKKQVREFVDFPATIPLWLNPGYLLQEIRYIKNHSALHLIYTNGIDSISLFENAIDGEMQNGTTNSMSMRDFREYLAYTQRSNSLLAWRYGDVGFALVGSERLPRLMRLVEGIQKQTPEVISGENRRLSS